MKMNILIMSLFGVVAVNTAMAQQMAEDIAPPVLSIPDETQIRNANFSNDPCPEARATLSETPNDLNIIQQDITRFTLCLQRAQLLERLNTIAIENIDTIETSLESRMQVSMPSFDMAALMPPMPQSMTNEMNASDDIYQEMASSQGNIDWLVHDIRGQGDGLMAVLSDDNGNIINVGSGEMLPDTNMKIVSISPMGVKVENDKKTEYLKWKN